MKPVHLKYKSIDKFETAIIGLKEYFNDVENPKDLTFTGTIKLHGTNTSVCYNDIIGLYTQGRHTLIDSVYDGFGFAPFVVIRKNEFIEIFKKIKEFYDIDTNNHTITIFGEWCGERIQKHVAIEKLKKRFVIFDICVTKIGVESNIDKTTWLTINMKNAMEKCIFANSDKEIYNIYDFKTYNVPIYFNNLEETARILTEFTNEVDKICPFAEAFGIIGVGEGIVWRHELPEGKRWIFKTKGKSHEGTKKSGVVSTFAGKTDDVKKFVDMVCTINRMDQAVKELYELRPDSEIFGTKPEMKHCKFVIDWIINDIIKEESELMENSNVDVKQMVSIVGSVVANYMKQFLKNT